MKFVLTFFYICLSILVFIYTDYRLFYSGKYFISYGQELPLSFSPYYLSDYQREFVIGSDGLYYVHKDQTFNFDNKEIWMKKIKKYCLMEKSILVYFEDRFGKNYELLIKRKIEEKHLCDFIVYENLKVYEENMICLDPYDKKYETLSRFRSLSVLVFLTCSLLLLNYLVRKYFFPLG